MLVYHRVIFGVKYLHENTESSVDDINKTYYIKMLRNVWVDIQADYNAIIIKGNS